MAYMCVICSVETPPLVALTREQWNTIEALISSSVDLTRLKKVSLLACAECVRLVQSAAAFRSTVLRGVRRLMTLLSGHTQNETEPETLSLPIKEERADSLLHVSSYAPMEMELLTVKPEDEIKPERSLVAEAPRDPDPLDIEENIPLTTVVRPEVFVNTCQPLTNMQATPVRSDDVKVATFTHGPMKSTPGGSTLPRLATKMATFTRRPVEASVTSREARARPTGEPAPDHTDQTTFTKLLSLLLVNRTDSDTSSAASAKDSVRATGVTSVGGGVATPTHTDKPEQNEPTMPTSTYFIHKLKDSEIKAEREAARSAPEFAEATHKCERCIVVFKCEREKEIHDRTVHSSLGAYECGACGHAERSLHALRAHTARHSLRYCCLLCPFRAPDETAVKEHRCDPQLMKRKRPVTHKGLVRKPPQKIDNPVKCKQCYAAFADEDKLKRHLERVHSKPDGPILCKICNKESKNAKAFYHHTLHHKRQQRSVDTIDPDLFCAECAKQFDSRSRYQAHMLTLKHSPKEHWRFECDVCGRRKPNKPALERHIITMHLKMEVYKCSECGRGFNARGALRRHRAAHAPPPRRAAPAHVCHLCASTFTAPKSLREHLLMHEGLRPHACPLCPATFTYSAALYTHNRLKHLKIKRNWKKKAKKKNKDKSA